MKILFVVQRILAGGTETHVLTLAKVLMRAGHQVGLFTAGGSYLLQFRRAGVQIHQIPAFLNGATEVTQAALRQTVAKQGYTVVHAHDSAGFRLLSRTALSARKVITVHGLYANRVDLRAAGRSAQAVIAVSSVVRSYVRSTGIAESKIHLIPNGVSAGTFRPKEDRGLRRELGIPNTAKVIGYAGRFTLSKQRVSKHVCIALARYAKRHRHVHVIIAGRMSKDVLGYMGPRVHVLGIIDHMPRFYRACDAVVGTARVALEAMVSSVPTLALGEARYLGRMTRHNFMHAYRSNFGDHGKIHPWHTSRLWADLDHIRHHPHTAAHYAKQTRHLVIKHFSNHHVAKRIIRVYQ